MVCFIVAVTCYHCPQEVTNMAECNGTITCHYNEVCVNCCLNPFYRKICFATCVQNRIQIHDMSALL